MNSLIFFLNAVETSNISKKNKNKNKARLNKN